MPRSRGSQSVDPIKLLKDDHEKVKGLFEEFEQARNKRSKMRIAREAILELDVHAGIEEEIFYPAFQAEASPNGMLLEAEEEHHVVHLLIAELKEMAEADERFEAKFMVLAENVRHHIDEEEKELLPKAKQALGAERLSELGEQMKRRKQELERQFKEEMAGAKAR
jgi:hemerythrin-like domain-containing protein